MHHLRLDPSGPVPADGGSCCSVVELRQYTLQPGQRGDLIRLFEQEFVEPQEALGMHVVGTFTDLDDADRFVWIRGFPSQQARADSLAAFYLGPLWAAKRDEANRTMVDSDDVLLLRPCVRQPTFPQLPARPGLGEYHTESAATVFQVRIFELRSPDREATSLRLVKQQFVPLAEVSGARVVAILRTDPAEPGFPRLPVRRDTHAIVVIGSYRNMGAYRQALKIIDGEAALAALHRQCARRRILRLAPTARSELR